MPGRLVGLAAALACAAATPAARADDIAAGLLACRDRAEAAARLACYDALAAPRTAIAFDGTGSATTPVFELAAPSRLRFESRDAIMVAYLLGAEGEVVQNLHRGGAGEGSYLIERPGRYSVQVNASGGWRIRIEEP